MSKSAFLLILSFLPILAGAVLSDAEGRALLSGMFYCDSTMDNLFQDSGEQQTNVTFETEFANFLARSGWTRSHVIEQLGVIATNQCGDVSMGTNVVARMAYDGVLHNLGEYGGTNALPVLDYVITHSYDRAAWGACRAYVKIAGLTPEAFAYYTDKITGTNSLSVSKIDDFYEAVVGQVRESGCPAVISNRIHRLIYGVAMDNRTLQGVIDDDLCAQWAGYAQSQNRKRQIGRILAAPKNTLVTRYFLPIQERLNAATNLVELSTNDFLNAGE